MRGGGEWCILLSMKRCIAMMGLLGVLCVGGVVWAQEVAEVAESPAECFARGMLELRAKEGGAATALPLLRKAAEAGYAPAQMALGTCYRLGEGVEKDEAESARLVGLAAEQGLPMAMNGMGVNYITGCGVEQDEAKAAEWYRKAAEAGYVRAKVNLAAMLRKGRAGVPKDEAAAARLYCEAAEYGDAVAQDMWGYCLCTGLGVEKNTAEGIKWYRAAANQGYAPALYKLGLRYERGEDVKRDIAQAEALYRRAAVQENALACGRLGSFCMTRDKDGSVTEEYTAERLAEGMHWLRVGMELGNAHAMYLLGVYHEKGRGTQVNMAEAYRLYKLAAEKGAAIAYFCVGLCHHKGKVGPRDYAAAAEWYLKGAEKGDAKCCNNIAYFYLRGLGVEKNYERALYWTQQAYKKGHCQAYCYMGWMYERGWGLPKNPELAVRWYSEMAKGYNAPGLYELGRCHYLGSGCEQDDEKALALWEAGCHMGQGKCSNSMGVCFMRRGIVPEPSDEIALKLFRVGEEKNNAAALYNLALCYEAGRGVPQDLRKAVQLYLRAAVEETRSAAAVLALRRLGVEPSEETDAEGYRFSIRRAEAAHTAGEVQELVLHEWEQEVDTGSEEGENWAAAMPRKEETAATEPEPWAGKMPKQETEAILDEGKACMARGEIDRATALFHAAAERGSTEALDRLALCNMLYGSDVATTKQLLQRAVNLRDEWAPLLMMALPAEQGGAAGSEQPE